MDLITHALMLISVILHCTLNEEYFAWARGFYALTLYLSCIRIIHIFYANEYLGTLVITIVHMVSIAIVDQK